MQLDEFVYKAVCRIPKNKKKYILTLISSLVAIYYLNKKRKLPDKREEDEESVVGKTRKSKKMAASDKLKRDLSHNGKWSRVKVGVNTQFVHQLRRILPICVPSNFQLKFENNLNFIFFKI
jgi:hypothetical protein